MFDAELRIVTEQQNATLFPGQIVQGNLHVIVKKTIKPRSIEIKLQGKMNTHIERSSGEDSQHFHEENKFLNIESSVWRPNVNGAGTEILPGDHYFPFQIRLPDSTDLPPSMNIPDCSIQYMLEAKIDLAWQIDPKATMELRVTGFCNADNPKYGEPLTGEDMKTLCCLCCASDPIICKVSLPKGYLGFGESSRATVSVTNGSDKEIKSVYLQLRQKVSYRAQGQYASRNNDDKRAEYPSKIDPFTRDLEFSLDFNIPEYVPSDFDTGAIIIIKNYIVVTLHFSGMTIDLHVSLPMLVGARRPSNYGYAAQPQYQMTPPGGYQMPPPGGYQVPPPGGYQVPPPGGYQVPPPGGYQMPPPGGYQVPPPGGYQVPPHGTAPQYSPDGHQMHPAGGYQMPPPGGYQMPPTAGYEMKPLGSH